VRKKKLQVSFIPLNQAYCGAIRYTKKAIFEGPICMCVQVGLMRNGRLMAEENPQSLMQSLACSSLEEVLLQLCIHQSSKSQETSSHTACLDKVLPVWTIRVYIKVAFSTSCVLPLIAKLFLI